MDDSHTTVPTEAILFVGAVGVFLFLLIKFFLYFNKIILCFKNLGFPRIGIPVKQHVRLVVLGKTGSGKSSLANILLGKKGRFECKSSGNSVTTTTEADEGYFKGRKITVVDTPGFFDTNVREEDNHREIIRCLMLSEPGPHVFCYCISIATRFTEEDAETFKRVKSIFGEYATKYMVIVFTNKDRLDGVTEEEYKESAPSDLKDVLKEIRDKPIFINSKSVKKESELDSLSTLIKNVNTDWYYTDVKYHRAIETLKRLVDIKGEFTMVYTELKDKRGVYDNSLAKIALDMKNMVKKVRIGKITGSVAGIVGTTMTIVGVVAAPLTFGTSLIVTAVGAGIGIVGGVTGGGATVADLVISKKRKKEMDALLQDDRKLLEKLGDEEVKFHNVLSEIFQINEIKGVIQNVLKKSIARSNNSEFKEEVKKGLDKSRDYLLKLLNAENMYLQLVEKETGHDTSLGAAKAAATAGGQVAKTVAVATDTTTDIVGSVAASTVTAVKVTAIAGLVLSAITLPLDLYTIVRSSRDLHLNEKHKLEKAIRDCREDLEKEMQDYDKKRDILNIFVDEVKSFINQGR